MESAVWAGQGKIGVPNGIMGVYEAEGDVEFMGQKVKLNDARAALSSGMAMVSEDRRGVGLLLDESIEDNIVFNAMQINGDYIKKLLGMSQKDTKAIRKHAEDMIRNWISAAFLRSSIPARFPAEISRRSASPER